MPKVTGKQKGALVSLRVMLYRYRITIEYDGTPFVGWQIQENESSVQGEIEKALYKLTNQFARVNGAGRTDAGVHAFGQVAHFDLGKEWDPKRIRDGLNAHLKPHSVSILEAEAVDLEFDARFSATQRHYLFRFIDRRPPLALEAFRAWRIPVPLDEKKMHDAAQVLVGHHDFTTFRSVHCQSKSPEKTVSKITIERIHDGVVVMNVSARSFLHNQVRSFAGAMKLVGQGKWSKADLKASLEACDRSACAAVAPPHGLYLLKVDYENVWPSN